MAWTSRVAILACALIVISCAYVLYDLNGESLDLTDRELVLVVSDSMGGNVTGYEVDSFPADTLVMVEHVLDHEKRFLKVGDVVSYHSGGALVHHRIVSVDMKKSVVMVHGDKSNSNEMVPLENINGKVVGTNHWLGVVTHFIIDNFIVFLAILFVICSVLVVNVVYSSPRKVVRANGH